MNSFIRTFFAEFLNQRKNYFGKSSAIITLLLWPVLSLTTTYFTYRSFPLIKMIKYGINDEKQLIVFLVSGSLIYNAFWSMVQGAGQIRYDRRSGTLERIFLSPASRLGFVYGRSFGGIIFNTWMFMVFSIFLLFLTAELSSHIALLMCGIFILEIIASTIWGGFITTLFIMTRDSNIIFLICDRPMNILSGTNVPVKAFPKLLMSISFIFPATYCIDFLRGCFFDNYEMSVHFSSFILLNVILVIITTICLIKIENHNRMTGNWNLY